MTDETETEEPKYSRELSDLEKEFVAATNKAMELIQKELEKADKHLDKAVEISKKYGVPFYSNISFLSQKYTPTSYYDKFGDIDPDIIYELSNYGDNSPGESEGWEHSAVC